MMRGFAPRIAKQATSELRLSVSVSLTRSRE